MALASKSHVPLASERKVRHDLRTMFRLTRQEQRLVAFILAAFLAGLGIKHWRETRETEAAVAEAAQAP
jgi:uncharacterized protein YdaU (DUF1376 family)